MGRKPLPKGKFKKNIPLRLQDSTISRIEAVVMSISKEVGVFRTRSEILEEWIEKMLAKEEKRIARLT